MTLSEIPPRTRPVRATSAPRLASPKVFMSSVQSVLPGVPWIGGYTLGQLGWPATGSVSSQLVNQHALIALIGETEAQA